MKITASNKIKISKREWQDIGKKAGWIEEETEYPEEAKAAGLIMLLQEDYSPGEISRALKIFGRGDSLNDLPIQDLITLKKLMEDNRDAEVVQEESGGKLVPENKETGISQLMPTVEELNPEASNDDVLTVAKKQKGGILKTLTSNIMGALGLK